MLIISEMLQQRPCQAKAGKCAWETWATEMFTEKTKTSANVTLGLRGRSAKPV